MKEYKVEAISSGLMSAKLPAAVEKSLAEKTALGWDLVSVAFGMNIWWVPTAYLTFCRIIEEKQV